MKSTLVKRGKFYSVRYFDEQRRRWTHTSLKTSKKAVADQRYGDFLKDCQKTELLGQFRVQPVPSSKLVTDFLEYMESKRSPRYVKLVRSFTRQWLAFFGANTLTTAITVHTIEKYAAQRKKNTCRTKKTQISNATVNRDLSALKHMLHKAERWGSVEVSPGRRVDLLKDDSTVRTDYFTAEQIRLLVGHAENDRNQRRNHFHDWPEFIVLDVNTGLRCQEMLFLEFSDIDWQSGVVHIRNKRHLSFSPKGRKERRVPLNEPAMSALYSMVRKKHEATDFVFHQHDGSRWKLVLESFRSLLKRCGLKRVGIHALRHYAGSPTIPGAGLEAASVKDVTSFNPA